MEGYVEITREMIEACLNDEIEMMYQDSSELKYPIDHFKKTGEYEDFFEEYLINNHIKVIDGKFYEPNEDYFADMGLAPDGRPLPDDKFEPVTFGDR